MKQKRLWKLPITLMLTVCLLSGCVQSISPSDPTDTVPPSVPTDTVEVTDSDTQQELSFLNEAEELRLSILSNTETPAITGTTYFVSNNGDDKNDGKSPETAWATLEKVSNADLSQGDGVLFERGGIFRGYLRCQNSITYSAYGDGAKPVITGSPENGAGSEKWTLYGETADGGQVWQYCRNMKDCGTIVFNEDEEWCYKVMPYWNGTGFVTEDGEPFDVLESLTDDLYFFSSADSLLPAKTGFVPLGDERYAYTDGPLYLRCDRGNPGEVFDSIEFCSKSKCSSGLVDMAKGCLVDNLCIKYTSDCGVMPGDAEGNDVIQNCEIAWCGGGVWAYDEGGRVITGGDGFSLITGITIRDCYIHHNYDNGITIECGSDPGRVVADVTAVGNLIDYNCGGIQIICFDEDMVSHNIIFRDFLIEDNYILHSGESWAAAVQLVTREAPTDDLAAGHSIRLGDLNTPLYAPNTVFKNNVIYSESVCNIWGAFTGDAMPQFIDNQIYVRKDTMVALWSPDPDSDFLWYCIGDENYNSEVLFNQELGSGNIVGYFD